MTSNIVAVVGSNSKGTTFTPENGDKYLMADRTMKHDFKEGEKVVILDTKKLESGLVFVTKAVRFIEKQTIKQAPKVIKIEPPKPVIKVNAVEEAFAQTMESVNKAIAALKLSHNKLSQAVAEKRQQEQINQQVLDRTATVFGLESPFYQQMQFTTAKALENIALEAAQANYLTAVDLTYQIAQQLGEKPFLGISEKLDELLNASKPAPEVITTEVAAVETEKPVGKKKLAAQAKKAEQEAAHQRHEAKKLKAKQDYEEKLRLEKEEQDRKDAAEAKHQEALAKRREARKAKKVMAVPVVSTVEAIQQ